MYLGSSLGSSFYVYDEPEFTVTVSDPDGDDFHATVTLFGRAPEACNWPQCNSKTVHLTGRGTNTTKFSTWWKLPGRYIVSSPSPSALTARLRSLAPHAPWR